MPTTTPQKRATRPPTNGATREAPFTLRATPTSDLPDDGNTLDGYLAVFNQKTLIDSWEGRFWEQVATGSMKRSFREDPPRIQFDHGHHPLVGSIPIAELVSAREEVDPELAPQGGAHIIGRLFDNWLIQPVRDAIAAKQIRGGSFRFDVMREKWEDADGKRITDEKELQDLLFQSWYADLPEDELLTRTLQELKIPEIGPVVWPAYDTTSASVRSQVIDLGKLDDPAERRKLAIGVFAAEAAERMSNTDNAQDGAEETSAADHPSEPTDNAQDGAEHDSAADSPDEVNDTQRSADGAPEDTSEDSAGQHLSSTGTRPTDATDQARELVFTDALAEIDTWGIAARE